MKQRDMIVIIVVVFVSVVLSFVLSSIVFNPPSDRQATIEVVGSVSPTFPKPDPTYFNSNSFDPTQFIRIGISNNTSPFNASSQ